MELRVPGEAWSDADDGRSEEMSASWSGGTPASLKPPFTVPPSFPLTRLGEDEGEGGAGDGAPVRRASSRLSRFAAASVSAVVLTASEVPDCAAGASDGAAGVADGAA